MALQLNLGAGRAPMEGWVNVDQIDGPGIDHVHDLDKYPWPWEDRTIYRVRMDNVLEHLANPMAALYEIHRILCYQGEALLKVPHVDSPAAWKPGHRQFFHEEWIFPFTQHSTSDGLDHSALFHLERTTLTHRHPWAWHQRHHLGRELLAWGKHGIEWLLTKPYGSEALRPKPPPGYQ